MDKKYFIFDTETGGLPDSVPMPSLLTLYGSLLDNQLNIIDEIHLKIRPDDGMYIVASPALAVNKINIYEHDQEAQLARDAANDLVEFFNKHKQQDCEIIPAGQNVNFDIAFTKELLKSAGVNWEHLVSRRHLDIASVAHFLILSGKLPEDLVPSLKGLAEHFGLSYEGAHNEKFDVKLTINVLRKLLQLTTGEQK